MQHDISFQIYHKILNIIVELHDLLTKSS